MRRRVFLTASLGSLAAGCAPAGATLHSGAALAFGTTVRVALFETDSARAAAAIDAALHELRAVDSLMSIYDERSQVFQLNRDGELAHPDPRLLVVLDQARALSLATRGAFDITVQPLWRAYREATQANGRPLPGVALRAGAKVGLRRVQAGPQSVRFSRPGMQLTLNGLAQGYAADLALASLRARGISDALVDAGEFAALGGKAGQGPWRVGVADPREAGMLAASLALDGRCVATSGDYAASFTPDFVHHHIFDPATGESPQELASVTVVAPSAMLADGLSTAFMVMGARRSHALAASFPNVDLLTINKRGLVWKSPRFPAAA